MENTTDYSCNLTINSWLPALLASGHSIVLRSIHHLARHPDLSASPVLEDELVPLDFDVSTSAPVLEDDLVPSACSDNLSNTCDVRSTLYQLYIKRRQFSIILLATTDDKHCTILKIAM